MNNHTATNQWMNLIHDLLAAPKQSSRIGDTYEILGNTCEVDMRSPIVVCPARKLSYKFMAAEAMWILSGSNRVDGIAPYNKRMADFSDDGVTLFGAYGPKIMNQLPWVAEQLARDRGTRQAVVNIWREDIITYGFSDADPVPRDVPCSLSLQWLIRDNKMHCFYTMRSSDAWLGWVYDVFNMTMVTCYLIGMVERLRQAGGLYPKALELGHLYWHAGSSHLYTNNEVRAREAMLLDLHAVDASQGVNGPQIRVSNLVTPLYQVTALEEMRARNALPSWVTV
jgi:thymidylate synthase